LPDNTCLANSTYQLSTTANIRSFTHGAPRDRLGIASSILLFFQSYNCKLFVRFARALILSFKTSLRKRQANSLLLCLCDYCRFLLRRKSPYNQRQKTFFHQIFL
jgi:hypothetical protein